MPTLRIPLIGSYVNRGENPSAASKDQFFTNCYPEIVRNPFTEKVTGFTYKRPGSTDSSAYSGVHTTTPKANAICTWTSKNAIGRPPVVLGFMNDTSSSTSVWDICAGTQVGGNISNTDAVFALTETVISGTSNLIGYFRDNSSTITEQWYYPDGGAWTQTTDSDFPTNCVGQPVCADGYVFNMTVDAKIYNSDINSLSSYQATSFLTMGRYPDTGVNLARIGKYIVGFGRSSIEFFENAGNPAGSVLRRTDLSYPIGALHVPHADATGPTLTVLSAFENVFWIGTDSGGAYLGVFALDGDMRPKKISNQAIDKLLAAQILSVPCLVGSLLLHGMRHIVLTVPVSSGNSVGTWCYCLDTDFWWRLTLADGVLITSAATTNQNITRGAQSYYGKQSGAKSGSFNTTNQDSSSDLTLTIQTDNIDAGTNKMKFWKELRAIYDVQSSTSNLAVSYSDDDFANFSTARNIDMSSTNNKLTRLGASRRRSWKFTNTANTPCRIHAVEIDYEVGAH